MLIFWPFMLEKFMLGPPQICSFVLTPSPVYAQNMPLCYIKINRFLRANTTCCHGGPRECHVLSRATARMSRAVTDDRANATCLSRAVNTTCAREACGALLANSPNYAFLVRFGVKLCSNYAGMLFFKFDPNYAKKYASIFWRGLQAGG